MTWGGRCPRCGEVFRGLRDGKTMGQHKSPYFYPFSSRREPCVYGGGTREDAVRGITPMMRRTQAHIVKRVVEQGPAMLTDSERELLAERGMLDETLEMIHARLLTPE